MAGWVQLLTITPSGHDSPPFTSFCAPHIVHDDKKVERHLKPPATLLFKKKLGPLMEKHVSCVDIYFACTCFTRTYYSQAFGDTFKSDVVAPECLHRAVRGVGMEESRFSHLSNIITWGGKEKQITWINTCWTGPLLQMKIKHHLYQITGFG